MSPDRAFQTASLRSDLRRRSISSGFVNLGSQAAQVLIGVGGTAVLARLLSPADFGVYAMVAVLMVVVGNLRDLGLPLATMHRQSIQHAEYSALFWIYQRFNLLTGLLVMTMGPVLVWFYHEPALTQITIAMALGVLALGVATPQEALLKRQMRFTTLTAIDVIGSGLGVLVAIGAALLGAGYWALVAQFMTMCLFKSILCWLVSSWRPSRVGRREASAAPGLRQLLKYGGDVTASRMVVEVGRNLDSILIGHFVGAQALGIYYYAFKWAHLPAKQIYGPLHSVAVSGLSRVQDEPKAYRGYLRRGLGPVFTLTIPGLALLALAADLFVPLLMGPQWDAAVPLLRILCVAAFFGMFNRVTKWLYLSSGETRRQLTWSLISTPVMIAAVSIGALWGVTGVAVGFTVGSGLLVYPGLRFCLARSHLHMSDIVVIAWRPAVVTAAATAALLAVQGTWLEMGSAVLQLALRVAVFGVAFLAVWLLIPGGLTSVRQMLRLTDALPWKRSMPLTRPAP